MLISLFSLYRHVITDNSIHTICIGDKPLYNQNPHLRFINYRRTKYKTIQRNAKDSFLSNAPATFCKNRNDGLPFPLSNRAILDCRVPIFSASCFCVIFFSVRAFIIWLISSYSGARASYSAFICASLKSSALNLSKSSITIIPLTYILSFVSVRFQALFAESCPSSFVSHEAEQLFLLSFPHPLQQRNRKS